MSLVQLLYSTVQNLQMLLDWPQMNCGSIISTHGLNYLMFSSTDTFKI
uniref:Uncharacterized protein n=1 Tax=Rhizophora mucronata TaxID=61149 RepID=A0A2P2QPA1_RHIMU